MVLGGLGTRSTELYDLSILRIRLGLLFFLEPWRDIKLNYLGHNILLIGERAHFYKPRDHGIGEIEEAKLAIPDPQRKLFPGLGEKPPSVCIIGAADVQPAHLVLKSGTLQS